LFLVREKKKNQTSAGKRRGRKRGIPPGQKKGEEGNPLVQIDPEEKRRIVLTFLRKRWPEKKKGGRRRAGLGLKKRRDRGGLGKRKM